MTGRDLYCFRQGKLELSILDEELDEEIIEDIVEDKTSIQEDQLDIELKISDDIYNTLKTMGEFLTQAGVPTNTKDFSEITSIKDMETISKVIEMQDYIDHNATLQQSSIDTVIISHFGEITPKYQYATELKQKIESEIKRIRDYK